ncbi:MAG: efflux RND transporter periplasmic adaptor subunit [Burkholderiales bacterium]|nr:efflux RND transporter periplasmic adaptor subunit [Burkholderiales bacterium]
MTNLKRSAWLLPATLVATAVGVAINHHAHAKDADATPVAPFTEEGGMLKVPQGSPLRQRLVVQAVGTSQSPHLIELPGQVDATPSRTVNILPPLTGRVVSLKVELGDTVKRGQELAVIASGDMAQAYSDVAKAHDALDLAKKTRDRTHGVEKTGAAAIKDIEAAESGYNQAEAELVRANTRLAALGGTAGAKAGAQQLIITAPTDGVVTTLNVGQGAMVNDPTAAMMVLSDLSKVWVTANVPENLVATVHKGDTANVTLSAYPGEILQGKVVSMSAVLAPDTRRLPIRIAFDNPHGHLMPNMYATVSVAVPQQAQVLVPQSALLMNNDSVTVLVETAPWSFVRRKVEISYDEGDQARITAGLKSGERVVVKGGVLMND